MKSVACAILLLGLLACGTPSTSDQVTTKNTPPREIHTPTYDLLLPTEPKSLLILFPCFSCDAADTRAESRIADTAAANGIAVLMTNFNRHILMSAAEESRSSGPTAEVARQDGT
ncbi:MAG TPA: hypothetical protein VGE21_09745 [Flavobacteriales bacterium]